MSCKAKPLVLWLIQFYTL